MACWSDRGCDDEMRSGCPHAIDPRERCPLGCNYAACDRPTHQATGDPSLIFDTTVDRTAAAKDTCVHCAFFLTNGPRL